MKYTHYQSMKKFALMCIACMTLLCTSCGFSREATSNSNVAQTEVVLAKRNFKVIGTVQGESSQTYIFGLGGLSKKSLASSAMQEMYQNAELEGSSRAVINVNVVYKDNFFIVAMQRKAIATGTLIEFIE